MIVLKGTQPVQWSKAYYEETIEQAKEKHKEFYPDYIIEEAVEEEDSVWRGLV
jgi:hypothetical protein